VLYLARNADLQLQNERCNTRTYSRNGCLLPSKFTSLPKKAIHFQALSSTHCHQVLPRTRAEVSSEPTTGLARTAAAMISAAATSGVCARLRILAIAPSLMDRLTLFPPGGGCPVFGYWREVIGQMPAGTGRKRIGRYGAEGSEGRTIASVFLPTAKTLVGR
jgi:hypothetical protein